MFLLLKRFLGRLILGWIMSLLVFMVQRAMKRMTMSSPHAETQHRSPTHAQQSSSPPLSHGFSSKPSGPNSMVRDALWQGMPEKDLLAAYGAPFSRSPRPIGGEIWVYTSTKKSDSPAAYPEMTVTLENGKVLSWID
jgi:hypothetical protein